jgi:S1-C subfamily serine protease
MTKRMLVTLIATLLACAAFAAEERPGYMGLTFTCERASDAESGAPGWLTVREIRAARPADLAGLEVGDLILELDGRKVEFRDDLDVYDLIEATVKPDTKLTLTILRDGKRQSIELLPARMSDESWEQWKANRAMLRAQRERHARQR